MSRHTPYHAAAFAWMLIAAITIGAYGGEISAPGNVARSSEEKVTTDAGSTAENIAESVVEEEGREGGSAEGDGEYCPGYRKGNPALVSNETEGCATGEGIGVIDHMLAFGIGSHVRNPNWTACGIPRLPNENERVCYKTTVFQCRESYQIFLNQRNLQTLLSSCPDDTDKIPLSPFGGRFLQSPRYDCVNSVNNLLKYRRSEFCLYDLSLPECTSGRVVIDNDLHFTQEVERRQRYNICSDYLQLFVGDTSYQQFCDSELSRIKLEIPSTRITAVFWTDTSNNNLGFKLHVTCAEDNNS